MKENIKNYNYHNFNFKIEPRCLTKSELSVEKSYNLSVQGEKISPVCGFASLLEEILGAENYADFAENYPLLCSNIIRVAPHSYFDQSAGGFKTIYFLVDGSFKLYKLEVSTTYTLTDLAIEFVSEPKIFSFNGKIYFYCFGDKFLFFEASTGMIAISNYVELETIANFQDRTFFAVSNEPYKLYYADKLEIEDISDELSNYNFIEIPPESGRVLKVVCLKNSVYVVCQFEISRIVISNQASYLTQNCTVGSVVRANSICQVNDYVVFFTLTGLYLFDGNEIKRVFENFTRGLVLGDLPSAVFDNKYYAILGQMTGTEQRNVIAEFDIQKMTASVYFAGNIQDIFCMKSENDYKLVARKSDLLAGHELLFLKLDSSASGEKYVKFNRICFDDNASKTISGIKTISTGNFTLKITSETSEKTFEVSDNLNVSAIGLTGYSFDIEIYSNSDFEVKAMLFSIQTI